MNVAVSVRAIFRGRAMDIAMDPKSLGILIAVLLFLISFLLNLLQRRYSKARFNRMLMKEESIMNFLMGIHKGLGRLERNCTFELHGASSPQEVGKAIHVARNEIESTIFNIEEHLRSFRQYRRKEKAKGKQRKPLEKLHPKTLRKVRLGNRVRFGSK
jgi:hypothetical protein